MPEAARQPAAVTSKSFGSSWVRRPNPVYSDDYAVLRSILTEARISAGISQRELARRLGKCQSHVCLIEGGQRRVDGLELFSWVRHLSDDPAGLLEKILHELDREQALVAAE